VIANCGYTLVKCYFCSSKTPFWEVYIFIMKSYTKYKKRHV